MSYTAYATPPHRRRTSSSSRCRCLELAEQAFLLGCYECSLWCDLMHAFGAAAWNGCSRTVHRWCDEINAEMQQQHPPRAPPPPPATFVYHPPSNTPIRYELASDEEDVAPSCALPRVSLPPPPPPLPERRLATCSSSSSTCSSSPSHSDSSSLCVHRHELDDVDIDRDDPWSIV